jgi:hypothetical protein
VFLPIVYFVFFTAYPPYQLFGLIMKSSVLGDKVSALLLHRGQWRQVDVIPLDEGVVQLLISPMLGLRVNQSVGGNKI